MSALSEDPRSEPARARRRRDLRRMKARAARLLPTVCAPERFADYLAQCSCWMCGNPRRYSGDPLMQERRALLAATDEG